MLNLFKIVFFIIFCITPISSICSIEPDASSETSTLKRYNLSVCAIFKNEFLHLKEWIEYHRLVGVDHFYLYDTKSGDRYLEILNPYIKRGIVTLINWHEYTGYQDENTVFIWSLTTQVAAYENAVKVLAGKDTKWLVFLDVGEFLVPAQGCTLTDLLEKYDEYPGVTFATDFFDASKLDKLGRKKLLIEALELKNAPKVNLEKQVTKTIFKPDLCRGFTWAPYKCRFKGEEKEVMLSKNELRINQYLNRNPGYLNFGKRKNKLHIDNRMLSDEEVKQLLDEGYEIEDQERAIYRFVPEMLRKMGLKSISE